MAGRMRRWAAKRLSRARPNTTVKSLVEQAVLPAQLPIQLRRVPADFTGTPLASFLVVRLMLIEGPLEA